MTISFGHGLSVAPLQAMMGVAALVNGGYLIPPTFLRRTEAEARAVAKRVVKPETSTAMRYLMRLNAEKGTATKADVKGYLCGRQDRHRRKGRPRPVFQEPADDDFMAVFRPTIPTISCSSCWTSRRRFRKPTVSPPPAGMRCRSPPR